VAPTKPSAPTRQCLAIVGVGLIGGSVGLAARRTGRFGPILGIGRDVAGLERAKALGCIDEGGLDLPAAARCADVVVICTPVNLIAEQILMAAANCRSGTLLTDAGSTKSAIVAAVERDIPEHVYFVGAHPLAGSEKRGPEQARSDLFDKRLTVMTPTPRTRKSAVERGSAFWRALGSRVKCLSPEQHDEGLALTSHLPHLLAAALAGILPSELHELTATGFRDTTRIAAGDPKLWTAIFAQNGRPVAAGLERLQARLLEFQAALVAGDMKTMDRFLTEAKKVRDDLGN
jgi:cyclohexadieny/prephenate dehydrogenase